MNASYGPIVLVAVTMVLAVYAATTSGPDQPATSKSAAGTGMAASEGAQQGSPPSGQGGAETASSAASNDQQGTPQAVWEELKEAGQETADIFTGDQTGQQARGEDQSAVGDVWEELKEAGHQTARIFVGDEPERQPGSAIGSPGQASTSSGQASTSPGSAIGSPGQASTSSQRQTAAGGSPGPMQPSGGGQSAQASRGQGSQPDVKVYTAQGRELGVISAIVINRDSDSVHALVIDDSGATAGASSSVDEKLRAALCGDRSQSRPR